MGNVMCCCRGREKNEEGKIEEEGPSIQSGIMKKSNPEESSTPTLSKAENRLQNSIPIYTPVASESKETATPISVKAMNEFSTFGGEKMDIFEEDYSSNKNKKKIIQPIQYVDTFADESKMEKSKKRIFINIFLDYLEINYKFCDDFGLVFKPIIEIQIEGNDSTIVYPKSNFDGETDKSLNISNISGVSEIDTSLNTSQNMKSNYSQFASSLKEKVFYLKFAETYEIPTLYYYSNIKIILKNELPIKKSQMKDTLNLPPSVIIAEASLPINILYNKYKETFFDGCLEMKLRSSAVVGILKATINASDKNNKNELLEKIQKSKNPDVSQDDIQKFDNLSIHSSNKFPVIWSHLYSEYQDLSPDSISNYFGSENINSPLPLKISQMSTQNIEPREIYHNFLEIQSNKSLLSIYQFFIFLIKIIKSNFSPVKEFFNLLNEDEKLVFFNLPQSLKENSYIFKLYLTFMLLYVKYYKSIDSLTILKQFYLDQTIIIKNTFELLQKLIERLKNNKTSITPEYHDEIRECLIMTLNILNELVSESSVLSKSQNDIDKRKNEYTTIYDNCIQIISKRIYIMRIYDTFMNDSMVMGSVFRLFRKVIQVLTNDSNSLLDLKKLNIHPKEFAANLKKILIEQSEGIYISTLRMVLMKFQHYSELHRNILIIIFHLTNFCDSQSLIWAAEKLNLLFFSKVFEIYRGRLKNSNKMLNNLHLNILANFSDIITETNYTNYEELSVLISKDIKSFYKANTEYSRRFEDFQQRKFYEIEIHETITRIGVNITRSQNSSENLMSSLFFDDIIVYLLTIADIDYKEDSQLTIATDSDSKYILKILEMRKNKINLEKVKKIISSILNNSIDIINNIMCLSDDIYDAFSYKLSENNMSSADEVVVVLERGRDLLLSNGVNVQTLSEKIERFKNFFQD